jgi:hypothetical protein
MADRDDAALMLQFLQWGTAMGFDEARGVLISPDWDPEGAEITDAPVRTALVFGETLAAFVKHGALDRALLDDVLWVAGLWSRVAPAALRAREQFGEPSLFENFEALARGS